MDTKLLIEAWKRGATSVGWGKKRNHEPERIIFGVPEKKDVPNSKDLNKITSDYTGVVQVDEIRALGTDRLRPARPGCSIGHYAITCGTFGLLCKRNGVPMILSNNHVLANTNDAQLGDAIFQPGPYDGGTAKDRIATLHQFIPLRFMNEDSTCKFSKAVAAAENKTWAGLKKKSRFKVIAHTTFADAIFNTVDCAMALPVDPDYVTDEIIGIGVPVGVVNIPELGTPVKKNGRTTDLTRDKIIQTDVTTQVSYGGGRVGIFTDQFMTGPMSMGGDSGSAVLTEDNKAVGLLFAGSDSVSIMNRITNVMAALNITI